MYRFFPVLANKVVIPMDTYVPLQARELVARANAAFVDAQRRGGLFGATANNLAAGNTEMACIGGDEELPPKPLVGALMARLRRAATLKR